MPYKKAGDSRGFGSIGKYIQGPGELANLGDYAKIYGQKALCLVDPFFFANLQSKLKSLLGDATICLEFGGVCSEAEICKVNEAGGGADVIIGLGGGQTLDTVKVAACALGKPMILCPTSAATDAPTSGLSVIHRQDQTIYPHFHAKNPEIVLVDTEIILEAPARLFVAGMGDALATYFEACANLACDNINTVGRGYRQTRLGMAVAKLSFELLMRHGRDALVCVQNKIRSEIFEDIVEANTLLSGLGFENTGCAIAHGLQSSMGIIEETTAFMHGEQVAFGALCQLIVEKQDSALFEQVQDFCHAVGLPITLQDIGIVDQIEAKVARIVDYALAEKSIIRVEPFLVSRDRLYHSILLANQKGIAKKQKKEQDC